MSFSNRLKRMRTNSGMSVRTLAEKIGVSPSFLYQLEKGESAPSFSTLRKLSEAFHCSVSVFVEDELPDDWVVVRRNHRKQLFTGQPGAHAELMLFLGSRSKRMQPLLIRVEPGTTLHDTFYDHQRDDFLYVITGSVSIRTAAKTYELEAGDSAYFTFTEPKEVTNRGEMTAELLWVVSPASSETADE